MFPAEGLLPGVENPSNASLDSGLSRQAFIAQLVVEALYISVPQSSGLDVERLDSLDLQPVLHAGNSNVN